MSTRDAAHAATSDDATYRADSPGDAPRRRKEGQVWSLDYTFGLIFFLFALLLAFALLLRTTLVDDGFSDLHAAAEAASERLMSVGYPPDWRSDDVVSPGLLTQDRLSARKAERLEELARDEYARSKGLFGSPYDYVVTFQEKNGSFLPLEDRCFLGSSDATEQKSVTIAPMPIAYYARSTAPQALLPTMVSLNATLFADDQLSELLSSLAAYRLVVLEEPRLSTVKEPYDAQKAASLERYVARGGILLLVGEVGLDDVFSLNLTPLNVSVDATGTTVEEPFLNLTGLTVTGIPLDALASSSASQRRYQSLALFPDGRDYAVRFTYGDGDLLYLGGLEGFFGGTSLLDHVAAALTANAIRPVAACENVTLSFAEPRNIVTVRRLVALDGRIVTMSVTLWEAP